MAKAAQGQPLGGQPQERTQWVIILRVRAANRQGTLKQSQTKSAVA